MRHKQDIDGYVRDVSTGNKLANKWERLAVKRHEKDLARQNTDEFPYVFDWGLVDRVISFIELFRHVKGKWAKNREHLKLAPWQKFCQGSIFGWTHRDTGLRRFSVVLIVVPRKNGKSIMAAGTGLYMMAADGEYSAEVYCGATTEKQAFAVFSPAKKMAVKQPQFRNFYGVEEHARKLFRPSDEAVFEPVIGKPGDGANPSLGIIDEYHEHDTDALYDTLSTGMGARDQGLMYVITTAGARINSPCHLMQQDLQAVLEGTSVDESLFGIIYTIDKDDDWTDEQALIKANPNYGVSVNPDILRRDQLKAMASPRKQNIFRTKHLDEWMGAREAWLNMVGWNNPEIIDPAMAIETFTGENSALGLDLSETDDLTGVVHCFRKQINNLDHYFFIGRYYATEAKILENQQYQEWEHDGQLTQCDGSSIDYEQVLEDIDEDRQIALVKSCFYDPAGAAVLAQRLQHDMNIEAVKVAQSYTNFTPAMKELERLIALGRIHHDGNPVLAWCMSNVIAKETMDGKMIRPVKGSKDSKIDGAVALMMAFIGQYVPEEDDGQEAAMAEYLDYINR